MRKRQLILRGLIVVGVLVGWTAADTVSAADEAAGSLQEQTSSGNLGAGGTTDVSGQDSASIVIEPKANGTIYLDPMATELEVELVLRRQETAASEDYRLRVKDGRSEEEQAADPVVWQFMPSRRVSFSAGEASKEVRLRLSGFQQAVIEADVEALADPAGGISAAEVALKVVRRPSDFAPTLEGTSVSGDTVTFEPSDPDDREFGLAIKNPQGGQIRCVRIGLQSGGSSDLRVDFAFPGNPSRSQCTDVVTALKPGEAEADFGLEQSRRIVGTVVGGLEARDYSALIQLSDPTEEDLGTSYLLSIEPTFTSWHPTLGMLYAFAAVFVGAAVSVFLNHAGPMLVLKASGRLRLSRALKRMERLKDSALRLRLANERHEIALKLGDIVLTSSQEERESVKADITALEDKLPVAAEIEWLREYHRRERRLPVVLIVGVFEHLRLASWHLSNGLLDEARKEIAAAKSIELTESELPKIEARLAEGILKIVALQPDPAGLGSLSSDLQLLQSKVPDLQAGKVPQGELADLDIRFFRLDRLVLQFDERISKSEMLIESLSLAGETADQCRERLRRELLSLLERAGGPSLEAASKMVRDMSTGFLPDQIAKRVEDGLGSIEVAPGSPAIGELAVFTLCLGEPYDSSTAARELDYRWKVPSTSLTSTGKRCSITFDIARAYKIEVEAKRTDGNWVKLEGGEQAFKVHSRMQSILPGKVKSTVFFVTVLLATILAWTMHFGAYTIEEFRDLFVPFLLGLGIDQFREKIESGGLQASELIK